MNKKILRKHIQNVHKIIRHSFLVIVLLEKGSNVKAEEGNPNKIY